MNFNSFIRYLLYLRWSRLFAYVFAFAGCFIIGYYFLIEQKNHRQTEWNFKNVSHFHSGDLELDSGRIYEIRWENIEGKAVVPTELVIDDEIYDTMNYFNLPYKSDLRRYVRAYINKFISNPTIIRVKKNMKFGIIFRVYTDINNNASGSFLGNWFDSWFDPVASIRWSVHDITDSYKNEFILFDGQMYVTYN